MLLSEFLDFDAIKTALSGGNKRSLLQQVASLAGQRLGRDPAAILASIVERERLGSTGFGQGVAIPHGKVEGLAQIYGLFVRLSEPIDYKAIDGQPVDLVFLLLSPPRLRGRPSEGAGGDQPGDPARADPGEDPRRAQQRRAGGRADGGG